LWLKAMRACVYVEINYGYSAQENVPSLVRKYGPAVPLGAASKLIVADPKLAASWEKLEPQVRAGLAPKLYCEVWDESRLLSMLKDTIGVEVDSICESGINDLRHAIDVAEGQHAFEET
jgi:hypothetical protein